MKQLSATAFLFLLLISHQAQSQSSESLKVMSYNIYNGFNWGKDPGRQDSMATWIQTQNPDVVAFQELCGFNKEKLLAWAKKFDHSYAEILKEEGYPVGITSKKPIKVKARITGGLWHGLLHAEINGVDYLVVHLSPSDLSIRMKEADLIVNYMKGAVNNNRFVVLGDFNAHSPFDAEFDKKNPNPLASSRISEARDEKIRNLRDKEYDYSVVSRFLSYPLIDVCQRFVSESERKTVPTPILIGVWSTAEEIKINKERIDFMLCSSSLAAEAVASHIHNSGIPDRLSDHYPLTAHFQIPIK